MKNTNIVIGALGVIALVFGVLYFNALMLNSVVLELFKNQVQSQLYPYPYPVNQSNSDVLGYGNGAIGPVHNQDETFREGLHIGRVDQFRVANTGALTQVLSTTATATPITLQNFITAATSSSAVKISFQTYGQSGAATDTASMLASLSNIGGNSAGGSGELVWRLLSAGVAETEMMRLTTTGLGIGKTPTTLLDVDGAATITELVMTNATSTRFMATNGTITNASTTYATLGTFWGTTGTLSGALSVSGVLTASATSTLGGVNYNVEIASTTNGFATGLVIKGSGFQMKSASSTSCYTVSVGNDGILRAQSSTCQ